jgi:hypothetical protein
MKTALICLLFIWLSEIAVAQNDNHKSLQTGNDLSNTCRHFTSQESSTFDDGVCMGYIAGVGDSIGFCGGENVTYGQMIKVVLKYMNDHPEQLNQQSSSIIHRALFDAFPCQK